MSTSWYVRKMFVSLPTFSIFSHGACLPPRILGEFHCCLLNTSKFGNPCHYTFRIIFGNHIDSLCISLRENFQAHFSLPGRLLSLPNCWSAIRSQNEKKVSFDHKKRRRNLSHAAHIENQESNIRTRTRMCVSFFFWSQKCPVLPKFLDSPQRVTDKHPFPSNICSSSLCGQCKASTANNSTWGQGSGAKASRAVVGLVTLPIGPSNRLARLSEQKDKIPEDEGGGRGVYPWKFQCFQRSWS